MSSEFSHDVFLSHNSADKPRVRELAERLRNAGARVWFDEWSIKPGDDIYLSLERGVESSRSLFLCMSPAAFGSSWVEMERSTVLFRDPSNAERRFIPILMSECRPPDALRRYKYIDYRSSGDAAFEEMLYACGCGPPRTESRNSSIHDDRTKALAALGRARRAEWIRMRADFELEARKYHDAKLSTYFVLKNGPVQNRKFSEKNYAINLWQFYGALDSTFAAKLTPDNFTSFGIKDAEVSAFGVVEGTATDLFRSMALRAGSLLPDSANGIIVQDIGTRFAAAFKTEKPVLVTNDNALAKWLNLMLVVTTTSFPERLVNGALVVDPFVGSLMIFDFVLGESS